MLIPIALTMMLILTRVGGSVVFCPDGSDGRSICNWPDGVLKYEISSSFNREEGKIIRDAVSHLETKLKGRIRFKETKRGKRVKITNHGSGACPSRTTSCCALPGYKWRSSYLNRNVWFPLNTETQMMNLGTWMENFNSFWDKVF